MQCLNSRHPQTEMRKQNQKIIKAWKLLNWNFIYCHKNEEFYDVMRNSICKLGRQFVLKTWPIDGQNVLIPVFTRWTYNNDQNDHDPAENSHFKLTYTNDFFSVFLAFSFFWVLLPLKTVCGLVCTIFIQISASFLFRLFFSDIVYHNRMSMDLHT